MERMAELADWLKSEGVEVTGHQEGTPEADGMVEFPGGWHVQVGVDMNPEYWILHHRNDAGKFEHVRQGEYQQERIVAKRIARAYRDETKRRLQ